MPIVYELPDPQPLAYQPTQPRPRPSPGVAVSWIVIVACVGYLAAGRRFQDAVARRAVGPAATQPLAVQPAPVQLTLAGRYAVGANQVFAALRGAKPRATTGPTSARTTAPATTPTASTMPTTAPVMAPATTPAADLLQQVDEAAARSWSAHDLFRAAIVAGEIAGPDAALSRLERAKPAWRLSSTFVDAEAPADAEALSTIYTEGPDALTAAQRDALTRRYDWFGQLALSYGRDGNDPQRKEAMQPAVRTVVVALLAMGLAFVAFATGIVLLVIAFVSWHGGKMRPAYRPPVAGRPTGPFLEAFAAYLAGMVVVSTGVALLFGRTPASTWFVIAIIPFAFLWPLLRKVGWLELRQGLGWTLGRGWAREIGAGLTAYVAGLPILAAGAAVTFVLQRFSGADTSHPIVEHVARGGAWRTVQLFFLAAVWAPVVEETMFRGAFYHHLRRRFRWPAAAAVVALVFAAVHPQGWAAIPVLGAIAFCFAATREWRGSIIAPAVAHALNNGAVTALLLLMLR